jgi:zinc transporter 7
MIAFATGGLLGDVCMHLIPHSFMGESETSAGTVIDGVRYVLVEEKRNIIIGVSSISLRQMYGKGFTEYVVIDFQGAIFGGFFAFYFLDKTMRVLNSSPDGEASAGSHSHHHHHHHAPAEAKSTAVETTVSSDGLKQRTKEKASDDDVVTPAEDKKTEVSASLRLSAYLNLFGDFSEYDEACTFGGIG